MSDDRIFKKCAWRLIPFMMLLYLVNYIDRVNVGFAALTMNKDLGFSPAVFGFGAGVFFLGYALFQVPAYWFPHEYRARYTASFMAAIPVSVIIGGPISGLILGMDGVFDLAGWRWLFLLEGLPACLLAFAVLKWLPDGPAAASWLTGDEQKTIAARLAVEDAAENHELWPALRDPRVLALGLVNFGIQCGLFGTALWLPQIVQEMGFSNRATGFIVAVPYLVSLGAIILWGRSSDARGERIWHVALPLLLAASGFAVASVTQNYLLELVALTFVLAGLLAAFPPMYSLPSSFLSGTAAAGGIALVVAIGVMGGFLGPAIVGALRGSSGNYSSSMAALAFVLLVSAVIVLAVGRAMALRKVRFA